MLTAAAVAVVAAVAAFVTVAGVAVYLMVKAARLMSEASAAITGLRGRGDLLIDRANAAIDQAGEQIARTGAVTASMAGVTASMAELGGHLTALAPAAPDQAHDAGGPLRRAAALVYGFRWALGMRRAAAPATRPRVPAPATRAGQWAALAGRADGTPR